MEHIELTAMLFGFYMLGAIAAMLINMQQINNTSTDYTFEKVVNLYFKKERFTCLVVLLVGVSYSTAHDEWVSVIAKNPDSWMAHWAGRVSIFSSLLGVAVQTSIYRFWLGKLLPTISLFTMFGSKKTPPTPPENESYVPPSNDK